MILETLPDDIQPIEGELWRMVSDSLDRYMKDFAVVRATISTTRGERNNINDVMRAISKERFEYVQKGDSFLIKHGNALMRPKKFSTTLETSNNPTQASLNFEKQVKPGWLPGLEPLNLNVGYVPDPIDLRNSTIWLTKPGPDGWVYQLKPPTTAVAPAPLPVTDPNLGERESRIVPKPTKKTKGVSDDDEK